jgi:hypothetical protein
VDRLENFVHERTEICVDFYVIIGKKEIKVSLSLALEACRVL